MINYKIFLFAICGAGFVYADGAFFGDPPNANNPWAVHDQNRPQPVIVTPGSRSSDAPSDATILFDGSAASFENWMHEKPEGKRKASWAVIDGVLTCKAGSGYIMTKDSFGDCQLHIEWAAPADGAGSNQNRGNSGVFFLGGMVEVQILNNYQNPTYADGTAGAVYGVMPPAANTLRPTGEWQSYDIIFRRPIVRDGAVLHPGSITVMCNGVVIQDSTPLNGGGGFKKRKPLNRVFPDVGSIKLQDHGSPVRFRNIWIRPLRPRALDGGTDGLLSPEATLAKRAQTARSIREDAVALNGIAKALRLMESTVYEANDAASAEAEAIIAEYIGSLDGQSSGQMQAERGSVRKIDQAYGYMLRYKMLPKDHTLAAKIHTIAIENGWVKQKDRR